MADLSQTAANVGIASAATRTRVVQAGESITQGQPVYQDTSNNKWYRTDANVQAKSRATGIALTPASTDGFFVIQEGVGGRVNLGATLTVGETYVCSRNVGAICPIGDMTTGDYPCVLGTAVTTAAIETVYYYSGALR